MTRVIAVFNQKGGTAKTTTAISLSSYLALLGKKVLLIDFDPQFNATVGSGADYRDKKTIYHAMFLDSPIEETVIPTSIYNFEIIPSSPDLAGAIVELATVEDRENFLRRTIENIRGNYDYIIIDMAPSLSLLTINGLIAADEVLIPVQCEYYSLEGLDQLLNTVRVINENLGHNLKITGALLTMHEEGEYLSEKISNEIKERFPHYIFKTVIPRSRGIAEAPSERRPALIYDPRSEGAKKYEELAREIIGQELSTKDPSLDSDFQ